MTKFSRDGSGPVIVAVPARNEADQIQNCLMSLAGQEIAPNAVLLLLNNCDDDTLGVANLIRDRLPFALQTKSVVLPAGLDNAGYARRMVMDLAAEMAGATGILLTTDADAVLPRDWVSQNVTAMAAGVDAVCGRIRIDPTEAGMIPLQLHEDDARECELLDLLDQIAWAFAADMHDPYPRHTQTAGASLAISAAAYRRVGGIPRVPSGEDRALIAALNRIDARVRHDPHIVVTVSARLHGRAAGGMADTIRRRSKQQDEFTDDQLEPAIDAYRRADFRRRLRLAWRHSLSARESLDLAVDLGQTPGALQRFLTLPYLGELHHQVERASPILLRRRVRFVDLPREIAIARQLLIELHGRGDVSRIAVAG